MIRASVRGLLLLLAAAAALLGVCGPAATASAQTSQQPGSLTLTAVLSGPPAGGRAPGRIVCHAAVSRPHFAVPSHRDIATAGAVQCSSRVAGISFSILLTRDSKAVAKHQSATVGRKRLAGAAFYKCPTNRTYRYAGVMVGVVVFPPGYTPHERTFALLSLPARLRCR